MGTARPREMWDETGPFVCRSLFVSLVGPSSGEIILRKRINSYITDHPDQKAKR